MEAVIPYDQMQNDTITYKPDGMTSRFTLLAGLIKNAVFRELSGAEKIIQSYNNVPLDSGTNGAVVWDSDSETVIFVAPDNWLYGDIDEGGLWTNIIDSNDVDTILLQVINYVRDNPVARWDNFLSALDRSVRTMMPQDFTVSTVISDLEGSSTEIDYLPDFSSVVNLLQLAHDNFTPEMLARAATTIAAAESIEGQEMSLGYTVSSSHENFDISFNVRIRF